MADDTHIELEGTIIFHAHDIFKVKVSDTQVITAKLSGKMRTNKINLDIGDRVKVAVSVYDTNRGRIMFRLRSSKEIAKDDQET